MTKHCHHILLGVAVVLIFAHGTHIEGDGEVRYRALKQWINSGIFPDIKYSMLGPLFSAPLVFLDSLFHTGLKITSAFNALLYAGALLWLHRLLRAFVSGCTRLNFLLILTCFSMFPAHLQQYYGEVFSSLALAIGFLLLYSERQKSGGVIIALGLANSPGLMFAAILTFGIKTIRKRNLKSVWIVGLASFLILGENYLKRGSFFQTGYGSDGEHGWQTILPYSGRPGFSYPLFLGFISILFSFGKGLIFFTPGSFLSARSWIQTCAPLCNLYRDWLTLLVGTVLFYSKWWAWYGGWFWGPRFFLFSSLLASLVLALGLEHAKTVRARVLVGGALFLSAWVGIAGALFGNLDLFEIASRNHSEHEAFIWYLPEFSVLWRPFAVGPVWSPWIGVQALFYAAIYLFMIRNWLGEWRNLFPFKKLPLFHAKP